MNDKLITILPSDIISESMIKINQNFEFIASKGEITDQKLLYYVNGISDRLKNIETQNSQRDANLMNGLNALDSKIDGLSSSIDIQDAIDKALANANIDVEQFIMDNLDTTVDRKLGEYVKTSFYQSDISDKLGNVNNQLNQLGGEVSRITSAFDNWQASAVTGTASASRIVANSTFYKTSDGFLVDKDGNETDYSTLEEWYNFGSIDGTPVIDLVDPRIDGERKGLEDDEVSNRLIQRAQNVFRTVTEQLSQIKQWIDENSAGINIVAAIKDEINPITAAIFVEASKTGSTIKLGADRLDFSGNKRINFETGNFTITSDNFNIDAAGNVTSNNMTANNMTTNNMTANNAVVNGDITATSLKIHEGILAGDLFVSDSENNVTAGMIGTNTSENDIRFFSGAHKIISPVTKQKIMLVAYNYNPVYTEIFVRYPGLDGVNTCTWVLDSKGSNRTLEDYSDSGQEDLDINWTIITNSEDVSINSTVTDSENNTYTIIDVSKYGDPKSSSFIVYEDGHLFAKQATLGGPTGGYGRQYLNIDGGDISIKNWADDTDNSFTQSHISSTGISFSDDERDIFSSFTCTTLAFGESGTVSTFTDNNAVIDYMGRIYVSNMYFMPDSQSVNSSTFNCGSYQVITSHSNSSVVTAILKDNLGDALRGTNHFILNLGHAASISLECSSLINIYSSTNGVSQTTSNGRHKLTYNNYPSVIHVYWTGDEWISYKIA